MLNRAIPQPIPSTDPREHRRRALKQGIISYAGGAITMDCIVRDQTDHGAKLRMLSPEPVPNEFELRVALDGTSKVCAVRWRDADHIGVEYLGASQRHVTHREQVVSQSIRESAVRRN